MEENELQSTVAVQADQTNVAGSAACRCIRLYKLQTCQSVDGEESWKSLSRMQSVDPSKRKNKDQAKVN